eukprot:911000-Lingulodinium_polyedra.AAC.1
MAVDKSARDSNTTIMKSPWQPEQRGRQYDRLQGALALLGMSAKMGPDFDATTVPLRHRDCVTAPAVAQEHA